MVYIFYAALKSCENVIIKLVCFPWKVRTLIWTAAFCVAQLSWLPYHHPILPTSWQDGISESRRRQQHVYTFIQWLGHVQVEDIRQSFVLGFKYQLVQLNFCWKVWLVVTSDWSIHYPNSSLVLRMPASWFCRLDMYHSAVVRHRPTRPKMGKGRPSIQLRRTVGTSPQFCLALRRTYGFVTRTFWPPDPKNFRYQWRHFSNGIWTLASSNSCEQYWALMFQAGQETNISTF